MAKSNRQTGKLSEEEKTSKKTRSKQHVSPLTANVADTTGSSRKRSTSKKSQKRARMEAKEDLEEQRLTAMLFGGDGGGADGGVSAFHGLEDDKKKSKKTGKNIAKLSSSSGKEDEESGAFAFEIDRLGHEDDDNMMENESGWIVPTTGDDDKSDDNDSDDESGIDGENEDRRLVESAAAAWVDDDDQKMSVDIVNSNSRLKKLRKHRDEAAAKALDGKEFERRLRQRYEETTQLTARTDWARLAEEDNKPKTATKGILDDDEDYGMQGDAAALLGSTSAPLLATSQHRLPPNILRVIRCPDANQSDPNQAVVQAVHFHPGSDPEKPLLLTAGLDKTLRFFQVGAEKSEKIHGIHFPKMPIYSASFLGDSGNVVVSGRRSFFYMYDAVAGKVDLVPRIIGRKERSWERHVASPDGKIIAFMGHDGYIVLVDSHSKHWITDLKMNGSVRAITFTPDSSHLVASGSDGDVYRWDLRSRRCVERFSNNDGTITSALAASSHQLAVGSESGVVNLYSEHSSGLHGTGNNNLLNQRKDPLKSIMNLHTSAECLRYNHDGQILAMSTRREKHGMKLLHVPSRTVFSNWPTSKTPLNYIWSMDFSPQSQFLAMGNDKGKCLLYRLLHYEQEG